MKKSFVLMLVFVLSLSLLLSACGGGGNKTEEGSKPAAEGDKTNANKPAAEPAKEEPPADAPKELSGELTIWTFATNTMEPMNAAFTKKYPNVKLNFQILSWDDMQKNLKTSIAAGNGGPDVAMVEGSFMSTLNTSEGLEDLLQAPYNAGDLKNNWTEGNWNRWLSLDGQKLLGLPWDMPPMATFYRSDILEENGFPSDPKELADYMASEENFLNMAQALKAKGIYILEGNTTIMDIYTAGNGFFDRSLNYVRNTDEYAHGLDLAKKVKQLGLSFNNSAFWSDPGKQAVASGKIAMVYYGPWILGSIRDAAPESKGKWRTTSLPLGTAAGNGGSTLSILSQSKNKELAWEYIRFTLATDEGVQANVDNGGSPGYIPAWSFPTILNYTNDMLGDQKPNEIWNPMTQKIQNIWVQTPLDKDAGDVWNKGITDAIDKNKDSKAALQQIADDIEKKVKVAKDELKQKLGVK
ncbi:extracellular solute-binding protein [Paenibacillus sp. sptzw28]|uniref:extracellular solute-binding protein n=1 Tax=Paenibacillus sp. sptzw28 TaxID=715179 RepID=UPI001C6E688A|nr:extracellular solute-binding protein [Paenibacillus sp. sptzw28]QYR21411.1 extracellular solute-binding protein [Paenibacillus sp. sptzw28]